MSSKRLHQILLASIALLLVGLAAGTYGANSLLAKEAANLTTVKAKAQGLDQEEASLIKAKADIQKYADLEKITRSIVPEEKSQAEAVRELVNIASNNGIKLGSITFPASTLGNGTKASSGTTAPVNNSKAGLSQLQPVKGISGVYQQTITVSSDTNSPVAYDKFVNFLKDLENNRRTAQVSSISIQPDTKDPGLLAFTLNLNNYIKP